MELGKLGILGLFDGCTGTETARLAQDIERLGYGALWFPHQMGREPFSFAATLLGRTDRLVVGTGVAIAFAYEPMIAASGARTLSEAFHDRFILGLGVSNQRYNSLRGFAYERPVEFMREYLARMKSAPYEAPRSVQEAPIVIAAMMPKMLELAAAETRGTLTYLTTTAQVAKYRAVLGPRPWLCAVQVVILETDTANARARAREYLALYLGIEHYLQRWKRFGFGDADFAGGGSDRLIDAVVAWGGEAEIRRRIADQLEAGATHVAMIPVDPRGGKAPDRRAIEALAPH